MIHNSTEPNKSLFDRFADGLYFAEGSGLCAIQELDIERRERLKTTIDKVEHLARNLDATSTDSIMVFHEDAGRVLAKKGEKKSPDIFFFVNKLLDFQQSGSSKKVTPALHWSVANEDVKLLASLKIVNEGDIQLRVDSEVKILQKFQFQRGFPKLYTDFAYTQQSGGPRRRLVLDFYPYTLLESGQICTDWDYLSIFLDVISAVEAAHNNGYAHCDIKPDNILIGFSDSLPSHFEAVLSDWEWAASPEDHQNRLSSHATPSYTAPEQLFDRPNIGHELTLPQIQRADLFSLGLSFAYTMLPQMSLNALKSRFHTEMQRTFNHRQYSTICDTESLIDLLDWGFRHLNLPTECAQQKNLGLELIRQALQQFSDTLSERMTRSSTPYFKKELLAIVQHMISISPEKRGSATSIRTLVQGIYDRYLSNNTLSVLADRFYREIDFDSDEDSSPITTAYDHGCNLLEDFFGTPIFVPNSSDIREKAQFYEMMKSRVLEVEDGFSKPARDLLNLSLELIKPDNTHTPTFTEIKTRLVQIIEENRREARAIYEAKN